MILATVLVLANVVSGPDLPSRFVELLERDDTAAIVTAAVPDPDLGSFDLIDLRDVVQMYDCIDVRHMNVVTESSTEDALTFRIDLTAEGMTSGGAKQHTLLPPVWFVTYIRTGEEWRIKSARTREGRLVERILAAPDEAARWEIVRTAEYDLSALAAALNASIRKNTGVWPFVRKLAASTGDIAIEANAYGEAARALKQDAPREAVELQPIGDRLARESGDPDAIAGAHFAAAVTRWFTDDIAGAIESFDRCGSMVDTLRDPRIALKCLHMGCILEMARGNVVAAASFNQRNAEASRRYGWEEGEANAASGMSLIHYYLGNRAESDAANQEALRHGTAIGGWATVSSALYNLADSEEHAGNYDQARALLERAAMTSLEAKQRLPMRLGDLLVHQGRFEEAEQQYRRTLTTLREHGDQIAEIAILIKLSRVARLRNRLEEALALAREAGTVLANGPSIRTDTEVAPWLTHAAAGNALAALGRRDEAAAEFEEALAAIETEKSTASGSASPSFLDERIEPFLALLRLRVAEGATAEVLRVSERLKARLLHDLLDRGQVDLRATLTPEERSQEEELNHRLVELNRAVVTGSGDDARLREALDQARAEQRAFAVRMQLAHPEARSTVAPPTTGEVQRWLDTGRLVPSRNALILDYIVGENETTLVAIAGEGSGGTDVRILTLPVTKKELAGEVQRLLSKIEKRELGYSEPAAELYQRLIAPLGPMLSGKTTISVIPHGTLWQLPFAVLRAPDGKHLLERASIHYAPSLAYLELHAGKARGWLSRDPSILALGNPAIGGSRSRVRALTRATLGDLPEAAREARTVGKLYDDAEVHVEQAATEEKVKASAAKHDVLHFATHGISQPTQPMYSSLVLATQSGTEDGLLEAREVVRLDLQAQLAVLSACETARGEVAEGEGVIGLSWAFLVAGCPRTIVTMWNADSASSAKAMIRFHRGVVRTPGGGSVAGALRDAQLELLRTPRYSHPYYWAGFVVVGAGW